jgi:predicted AAA+ superfamily ATPase
MWIQRDITNSIIQNTDLIQIIRGPRQCGKSSLLLKLDPEFKELSLDDPSLRELAQNDPELFLKQFNSQKLFIDEAQYSPALFPSLKRRADLYRRDPKNKLQTILRLTGSNQILMDRNIKESLAGRASFFDMNTLSVSEILSAQNNRSIQEILFMGGWPALYANENQNPKKYLDDYINSYIEKDIVLSAGILKSREFLKFIKLLAGRVAGLLDYSSLANDAGVDSKTIKDWVSVLEKMHVISLVMPYSSNLSSRLTKSPKIYFLDTGLACRLQGWTTPEPILTSPQQGALFENLVFSEIYKLNINFDLGWQIYHWRSKDGEEIDFLIQKDPLHYLFIEAKVSPVSIKPPEIFPEVKKVFKSKVPSLIVCHQEGTEVLSHHVPVALLKSYFL